MAEEITYDESGSPKKSVAGRPFEMIERIRRVVVRRPPEEVPPPDEFVLRLIEAVMVRRPVPPTPPVAPPVAPPPKVVAPPEKKVVPYYIEMDLPSGTKSHEVNFGIRARALNIRTDGDISVRLSRGERHIPVSAADSPFALNISEGWIERVWITAPYGANVKIFASTVPISISYGRKELPTAYRWHWAGQVSQPARTYSEYEVYSVPSDRRLVVEAAILSSDVKGVVQRVDFLEGPEVPLYRFGGTFFDCQAWVPINYKMVGGKILRMYTYNYDTEDRIIWVVISSREEALK